MKKDIHPKYVETVIRCACGNEVVTRSTVENISVEICANCHPFYTGKQKLVDTAGRVERFRRRYGLEEDESTTKAIDQAEKRRLEKVEREKAKTAERKTVVAEAREESPAGRKAGEVKAEAAHAIEPVAEIEPVKKTVQEEKPETVKAEATGAPAPAEEKPVPEKKRRVRPKRKAPLKEKTDEKVETAEKAGEKEDVEVKSEAKREEARKTKTVKKTTTKPRKAPTKKKTETKTEKTTKAEPKE